MEKCLGWNLLISLKNLQLLINSLRINLCNSKMKDWNTSPSKVVTQIAYKKQKKKKKRIDSRHAYLYTIRKAYSG